MFYSIRKQLKHKIFDFQIRKIKKTKPIFLNKKNKFTIVSQVYPSDTMMYLLAIKSFTRFIQPSKIIVLGDRLRAKDRALLQQHIIGIQIINIDSINWLRI